MTAADTTPISATLLRRKEPTVLDQRAMGAIISPIATCARSYTMVTSTMDPSRRIQLPTRRLLMLGTEEMAHPRPIPMGTGHTKPSIETIALRSISTTLSGRGSVKLCEVLILYHPTLLVAF